MKIRVIILTIMLLFAGLPVAGDQHTLAQAEQAYQSGNYQAAVAFYEFALLETPHNGAVYANLGHAYFMSGQSGKAMLNYRRAQQYLPRNEIIAAQIAEIEREQGNGILKVTDPLTIISNMTAQYLTLTELSVMVFGLWVLFFAGLITVWRWSGLSIPVILIGVAVLIGGILLAIRLYDEVQRPAAIIIVEEIPALSIPASNALTLFVLYEGIDLKVVDFREGWVKIVLVDGSQGWILESSLDYIPNRLG